MKALTNNEIREQVRKKVSKQYSEKINSLEDKIQYYKDLFVNNERKCAELKNENNNLKDENLELKEKLKSYEEWLERMQDFCNLPEEERINAINKFKSEKALNNKLDSMLNMYTSFFDKLFY